MEQRLSRRSVILFYGGLGLGALAWNWIRGESAYHLLIPGTPSGLATELVFGLCFGLAVVVLSQLADRHIPIVKRLGDELKELLPPLDGGDIAIMAVMSGLGEELFFRGAMQDAWGLWVTVALFAVVHGFFIPRYLVWMAFAAIIAVALGYMVIWLGSLLAPIIAHITINYFNLHALNRGRMPNGDEL